MPNKVDVPSIEEALELLVLLGRRIRGGLAGDRECRIPLLALRMIGWHFCLNAVLELEKGVGRHPLGEGEATQVACSFPPSRVYRAYPCGVSLGGLRAQTQGAEVGAAEVPPPVSKQVLVDLLGRREDEPRAQARPPYDLKCRRPCKRNSRHTSTSSHY